MSSNKIVTLNESVGSLISKIGHFIIYKMLCKSLQLQARIRPLGSTKLYTRQCVYNQLMSRQYSLKRTKTYMAGISYIQYSNIIKGVSVSQLLISSQSKTIIEKKRVNIYLYYYYPNRAPLYFLFIYLIVLSFRVCLQFEHLRNSNQWKSNPRHLKFFFSKGTSLTHFFFLWENLAFHCSLCLHFLSFFLFFFNYRNLKRNLEFGSTDT